MFSKDAKHYRRTPRTMSEAFGPYARFEDVKVCRRHQRLVAAVGVIVLGVIYGLLFGWRG